MATLAPATNPSGNPILDAFTQYHDKVSALNIGAGRDMSPKPVAPSPVASIGSIDFGEPTSKLPSGASSYAPVDTLTPGWKASQAISEAIKTPSGQTTAPGQMDFYKAAATHETQMQNIQNLAGGEAYGYFQFTPDTWNGVARANPDLGISPVANGREILSTDFETQSKAYKTLVTQNAKILDQAGIPISDKSVFMASFLGGGGAVRFMHGLQTDPGDSADKYVNRAAAAANRTIFYDKAGNPKSLAQVYTRMTGMFASENTTGYEPHPQDGVQSQAQGQSADPLDSNFAKNQAYIKPGDHNYTTELSKQQEQDFRSWVKDNKIPFNPSEPKQDYDMRGFYKAMQSGDPLAKNAINPNDHQIHYPDYWKTPYHKSFSNESQWADPTKAPAWNDKDQLVLPSGDITFDERTQ